MRTIYMEIDHILECTNPAHKILNNCDKDADTVPLLEKYPGQARGHTDNFFCQTGS